MPLPTSPGRKRHFDRKHCARIEARLSSSAILVFDSFCLRSPLHRLRSAARGTTVLAWVGFMEDDQQWMEVALQEARRAATLGEVPVGAVVVRNGELIAQASNRRETEGNPVAHAEVLAIQAAAVAVEGWRLIDCTLYVTLEPCAMCAGALVNSRVSGLVFGARDPKAGFCGSLGNLVQDHRLNHRVDIREGVLEDVCSQVLKSFFSRLRR